MKYKTNLYHSPGTSACTFNIKLLYCLCKGPQEGWKMGLAFSKPEPSKETIASAKSKIKERRKEKKKIF